MRPMRRATEQAGRAEHDAVLLPGARTVQVLRSASRREVRAMTQQDARERASGTERDAIIVAAIEVLRAARSFGGPNRGVGGKDSEAWVVKALRSYRDAIYAAAKREDEERIAALRVGAQEMVAMQEALYGPCEPECECSTAQLKAVLDGIPFGPPQERALRVAAQQVVDDYLAGVPMLRVSITELRRALAGQTEEVVS